MRAGTNTLTRIREFRREDKEAVRSILEETSVFTDEEIAIALELIDIYLDDPNQKDYSLYTAADENGSVDGYVCVGPAPLTSGTFDLYWIAVKPSVQGSGVGRRLMEKAEEFVREQHGRLLIAETSSQPSYEPTRTFYLRNKYTEISRVKDYYKPSDDLVVFGKYLSLSEGSE
jgi:ribosomal protein S18 acetylase RimI-like enzyme